MLNQARHSASFRMSDLAVLCFKRGGFMSRQSNDEFIDGRLINGYDYDNQAWVLKGQYVRCGHPLTMDCQCYGLKHEGEETE